MLDTLGIFLLLAGFVLGLGAVTVIDIHGFLGRTSRYWTEATTRTHKVTKPLIWAGITLAIAGGLVAYRHEPFAGMPLLHACIAAALVLNGLFLSFRVSPYLLARERARESDAILPPSWQRRIATSLVVSDLGWWSALATLAWWLAHR